MGWYNYKILPFDLSMAKTPENPDGLEVVTKTGKPVKIIYTKRRTYNNSPIVALICDPEDGMDEILSYDEKGFSPSYYHTDKYTLKLKQPFSTTD